jgi:propanol-preferring alcohol dehydrogenase
MNELLEMAVAGDVVPHVEVFEFTDIPDVLSRLAKSQIEGRAVIRIPQRSPQMVINIYPG